MPAEPLQVPQLLLDRDTQLRFSALQHAERLQLVAEYAAKMGGHYGDAIAQQNLWQCIVSSYLTITAPALKPVPALAACLTPNASENDIIVEEEEKEVAVPVAVRQQPAQQQQPPSAGAAAHSALLVPDLNDLFRPTTDINDYTFIKTLGQGTFGKVKLAEHKQTKQQVAVKIIDKANIKTPKQRNSLCREIRLLRLLNHPHILRVIDVVETSEQILIFTEYASGGELFDYIVQHKYIKEPEARVFFRQIVSAMSYCHQNSVIHRDLKPENLLLDADKRIKIIDFGFVNMYKTDDVLDTFCGSPFYAAPEMVRGIKYTGPEVDVWSLGVILYVLLSGRLPFDAETMPKLYDKIAGGEYRIPSNFSAGAIDLIARMLTVDPRKRATLDTVLAHPWLHDGHFEPLPMQVSVRQMPLTAIRPDIVAAIASFGYSEQEIYALLTSNTQLHPVVSYYHLIWEASVRQGDARKRADSLYQSQLLASSLPPSSTLSDPPVFQLPPSLIPSSLIFGGATTPTTAGPVAAPVARPATALAPVPVSFSTSPVKVPERPVSAKYTFDQTHISPPPTSTAVSPRRLFASRPRSSSPDSGCAYRHAPTASVCPKTLAPVASSNSSEHIRSVRGFFSVSTTSDKPLPFITAEVERALSHSNVDWIKVADFTYFCEELVQDAETGMTDRSKGAKFELEICKVDRLTSYCVQTKRIKGTVWGYKKLCGKLLSEMQLR
ncbi:hypothetical protein RI367_005041 [Sorochytrium milnesiophthora]